MKHYYINSDGEVDCLEHKDHKYIKREWANGKWRYYYDEGPTTGYDNVKGKWDEFAAKSNKTSSEAEKEAEKATKKADGAAKLNSFVNNIVGDNDSKLANDIKTKVDENASKKAEEAEKATNAAKKASTINKVAETIDKAIDDVEDLVEAGKNFFAKLRKKK